MSERTPHIAEVRVPCENVNDPVATIVAWHAGDGEVVCAGQTVVELETSKAVFPLQSPESGTLRRFGAAGMDVPIGEILFCITDSPDVAIDAPAWLENVDAAMPDTFSVTRFSRRARELITQRGIDEKRFIGRGLICADDVLRELGERTGHATRASSIDPTLYHVGVAAVPFTIQPLSPGKRSEIRSLRSAAASALVSEVVVACPGGAFRKTADKRFAGAGLPIAAMIYEVARVLRQYPCFNAFYDGRQMAVYDAVNVGMATDAGHGLKVLVIRDADRKPLRTIADEFQSKVLRYMNNTLTLEDVTGATFSITDLSAFDVTLFHPMLPQGQSAILGIGADRDTASGRCFNLILAFDHQLAEGRQAAEALRAIRDRWASYERITCDE